MIRIAHRVGSRAATALLSAFLLLGSAVAAAGQVTPLVPLEARAYRDLDALLSAGLVEHAVVGQRPYSRLMIAQVVVEARRALPRRSNLPPASRDRLERILARLEEEYGRELAAFATTAARAHGGAVARTDGALLELTALDSPDRPIADVGLGTVDAAINPLAQNRGGRAYGQGVTGAVELAASGSLGRHLAGAVHGRAATGGVDVRAMNATVGSSNVVLQLGRVPLLYGQGMAGGLFASRNAPGLDMIRLATDRPAHAPGPLRRLGALQGSLFVADLGADQYFPHSRMAGWKVSVVPSRRFEAGASLFTIQGGRGAPAASLGERIVDLLTIVDVLFYQDRDLLISNKMAGFDFRVRLPAAEVYFDGMADDFDVRRLGSSLWEDAGYVAGIVLPARGAEGSLRLDAELQHTGLRFYEHAQFKSGVATRGQFIGIPLGARGDGLAVRLRRDGARGRSAELTGAIERRSGDRYRIETAGPDDAGWDYVRVEDRPEETRLRLLAGYALAHPRTGLRLELEGGYERVLDAGFAAGAARNNLLVRVAVARGFD